VAELKASLGLQQNDFVMMFLGRLSREKSIEELLFQFSKIKKENLKLLLVGGGPDQAIFVKCAEKNGISNRVIFTGMVAPEEVAKYYQIGDLFVNFSVTETQGLTYYEALASGLPLLVKYDVNLEGVVENGRNGYSFLNNDDFVSIFNKIDNNSILLNEITNNSNKGISRFSAENYAISVEGIYKKLLK
jgi:1,2-diacylglycerol 3-alpha-glucosyltransferase